MSDSFPPFSIDDFDAVVLVNGDYPTHAYSLSLLQHPFLVCSDGAADALISHELSPVAVVCDGDSISEAARQRWADHLHISADQETNDQTKAIRYCKAKGKKRIALLGATGKRDDHTLGNIFLLPEYAREGLEVTIITDWGWFSMVGPSVRPAAHEIKSIPGQQISLFALDLFPLTAFGLKYPIENRRFTALWQGTLNEALEDRFILFTQGAILVYRTFFTGHSDNP